MSATVESPVPWRKAAKRFVANGLFRSRSTHFDLVAKTGTRPCVSEVPNSNGAGRLDDVFERQTDWNIMVNGVESSTSASPSFRHRIGFSSHFSKVCQHLQINVPTLAIPSCLRSDRSRLLSQSSEALSTVQVQTVQTVPATAPIAVPERKKTFDAPIACSFSAPVEGATATVVVGAGVRDVDDGSGRTSIPSVLCELVAGLLNDLLVDQLLVIDCRSFVAYNSNHVRGALNISCADCISRKRLLTGRITIGDLVSGFDDAKDQYQRAVEVVKSGNKNAVQVIVYDEDTVNFDELPANSPLRLVVSCLLKTGFDVYYMFGELPCFCVVLTRSDHVRCAGAWRQLLSVVFHQIRESHQRQDIDDIVVVVV